MVDISFELNERLQACQEQYLLHFAGQIRLTRDVNLLDALIGEVESIAKLAANEPALMDAASQQKEMFCQERDAIVAAHEQGGAVGRLTAGLARRASMVMHRYLRNFAGQPRASRDVGLLHEILVDLQSLYDGLLPHAPDQAEIIKPWLKTLQAESSYIIASRNDGTPAAQAAAWGSAANTLLDTYVMHCVDVRRLAVRPALIARLLKELETIHAAMQKLQQEGLQLPHHQETLNILAEQTTVWKREHWQTSMTHTQATVEDRATALNNELDDILSAHNSFADGQPPTRQDMHRLCERLDEIEHQLRALQLPDRDYLMVASDALALMCSHYDEANPAISSP